MTGPEAVGVGLGFLAIVAPEFWPKMPRALSYTLAGIGLSWLTYSGILGIEEYSHMKLQHASLALIIAGAILIAGGLFWHISHTPVAGSESPSAKEVSKAPNPRISVDCHQEVLPKTVPANESLQVLWLFPTPVENGGGGMVTQFNTSGQPWKWPIDDPMKAVFITAYRCEITNYGNDPLFDLQMALDLIFYEAIPVPGQKDAKGQGKIKLHREWNVLIQKIDSGRENSFKFYILNHQPDLFVHVLMPKTATLRLLGAEQRIQTNLTVAEPGRIQPLFFSPHLNPEPAPKATPSDGSR
jgi:hypothetical protein